MILGYFEPKNSYTFADLESITGKIAEKGSWSFQWSIWFAKHGYKITHYSTFDFNAFNREGIEYIRRAYGDETADWQAANSDIPQARTLVEQYLLQVHIIKRRPTISDIEFELNSGGVVKVMVNSNTLNNTAGYTGHSVVILDIDVSDVWFHDPGLPAVANRKVKLLKFQEAMNSFGGEMDVIRKK